MIKMPQVIINEIAELTSQNYHGEAMTMLAYEVDTKLGRAFESLNTKHAQIGYLSSELAANREVLWDLLVERVRDEFSNARSILGAF